VAAGGLLLASCASFDSIRAATEWDLAGATQTAHLELTVWVGSSSCNKFDSVVTTESASDVTIIARLRVDATAGGCTSDLTRTVVGVDLEAPLGDRELLGCRPANAVVRSEGKGKDPGPRCGA
jgi:hypothetical protein